MRERVHAQRLSDCPLRLREKPGIHKERRGNVHFGSVVWQHGIPSLFNSYRHFIMEAVKRLSWWSLTVK